MERNGLINLNEMKEQSTQLIIGLNRKKIDTLIKLCFDPDNEKDRIEIEEAAKRCSVEQVIIGIPALEQKTLTTPI
jgi:hypothetical protein